MNREPVDRRNVLRAIGAAAADCYMGGENERIVGRALKGARNKVILATKVHIGPVDQMMRSVENSLRSLDTDVIDYGRETTG